MLKHIVMWRIDSNAEGSREQNAARIKDMLESLRGRLDGLIEIEAGINVIPGDDACDLVLVSAFRDRAALQAYLSHPEHLRIGEFVKAVRTERRVVDYETD
jgi:quinol monooxygenase YgiN